MELFRRHLATQHTEDWSRFQSLSEQERASFFNVTEVNAGILRYLVNDKDTLHFVITRSEIVTNIVAEMFFHTEEEDLECSTSEAVTRANALKLFNREDDGSFSVTIKNVLRFDLAVQSIASGCTMRRHSSTLPGTVCKDVFHFCGSYAAELLQHSRTPPRWKATSP